MTTALTTTRQVIEALGGTAEVARLTGRKYPAAWNWNRFDGFPPDTFVVMRDELSARGYHAPVSLWGMVERPCEAAE